MPQQRSHFWPIVTVVVGITIALIALPQNWKTWAPSFLRSPSLHLGLDLVGGTQLDFRISEEEINAQLKDLDAQVAAAQTKGASADEINRLKAQQKSIQDQQKSIVEAIRTVLERRINALGVSEAVITPSYIGNEKHLLVECPGVVDTQECIKVVGKTIQLEFKEEQTEATAEYTGTVKAKVDATMKRITASGSNLRKEGQDIGSQLGMVYNDSHAFFKGDLPKGLEDLWTKQPGSTVYRRDATIQVGKQDKDGKPTVENVPGIFLAEITKPLTMTGRTIAEIPTAFTMLSKTETGASYAYHAGIALDTGLDPAVATALRSMQSGQLQSAASADGTSHVLFLRGTEAGKETIDVSHILVAYKGASQAEASVTRTRDEALAKAKELKARIDKGESFAAIAKAESDGASTKKDGGRLGEIGHGTWPAAFDTAAFALKKDQVSDPVETPYGFHIIKANALAKTSATKASYDDLVIKGANAAARATAVIEKVKNGQVRTQEQALTLRTLFFSLQPTGWKDTTLDGKHFRAANVAVDQMTNVPMVQILFDTEGGRLFQELTKRNVGKRIAIFVGGQLVSAPTVQQEIAGGTAVITGSRNFDEAKNLAQDLNTGAIPAPIHLVGQYTIEATLGAAALQTSLQAALIGTLILMVYMILIYRLLGVMADIALGLYAVMLFAILKLPLLLFTSDYIVLTLAGMAGIILSIGMAVDANVLVFERMKEEIRKGKLVKTAVEGSFKHAWPAIRDSNVSTLITCGILFIIGTSIIRGFAITLAMGVFLSLFTAVTVTRWLLRHLARTKIAERTEFFCGMRSTSAPDDVPVP